MAAYAAVSDHAKKVMLDTMTKVTMDVKSFSLVNTLESPDRSVYRMVVTVTNRGGSSISYTARSLVVEFSPNHTLGANGGEQGVLRAGEAVDLTREFTMAAPVVADLRAIKTLAAKGELMIEASAKWLFWGLDAGVRPRFTHTILFD